MEIEWNNKDPFCDRDLENFKRLHADGVISIGVIITRRNSLQDAFRQVIENFARKNDMSREDNPRFLCADATTVKDNRKEHPITRFI